MRNHSLAALVALLSLGCQQDASLTGPSVESSFAVRTESGIASRSSALINPGPLCTGARSPGFYCQNQGGKNPNLDPVEFAELEMAAEALLGSPDPLMGTPVGEAVCSKGNAPPADQLVRHLATLSLNLAANLIDETTPLTDGSFPTVGDAFAEAIAIANDPGASKSDRNAIKDVLDDINNNVNTALGEECGGEDDGGEEE